MAGKRTRSRGAGKSSRGRGRGTLSSTNHTIMEDDLVAVNNVEGERHVETQTEIIMNTASTKKGKKDKDPHLVPGDNWFGKNHVTQFVVQAMKTNYEGPFMNYTETPKETIDHWFRIFRTICTWAPEHEDLIRPEFDSTIQRRLKDTMGEVRKKRTTPKWMTQASFEQVQVKKKDPNFVKSLAIAKANKRRTADSDGNIRATHHMGSQSTIDFIEKTASKNKGQLPNAPTIFYDAHTRKTKDGCRIFTKERYMQIYNSFEEKKAEAAKTGVPISDDVIFYDVVGGHKKGKVYGLGSASNLYYQPILAQRCVVLAVLLNTRLTYYLNFMRSKSVGRS